MVWRLLLGLVLLSVASTVAAQPAAGGFAKTTVQPLKTPLDCDRVTTANGLPNAVVHAMTQDTHGFMWFGTDDGVARYDGTRMVVYRPIEKDDRSILPGVTTDMAVDASGKVWISSENGVSVYDPDSDKFTRFNHSNGLSSDGVTALLRDPKDRIWLALGGGGVSVFEPTTKTFKHFPLNGAISAMDADKAGNLWLGTTEGVVRWTPDTNATVIFKPDALAIENAGVSAITVLSSGPVLIGTDGNGLRKLEPETKKVTTYRTTPGDPTTIGDDHIYIAFEDKAGAVWIGTQAGADRIEKNGTITRYPYDPDDPSDETLLSIPYVTSIFQDSGNQMWLGGITYGLCKFDDLRLNLGHYHTKSVTTTFWEDPDGSLWVGAYGLYHYDWRARTVTVYHTLGKPLGKDLGELTATTWITAVMRDRHGTLWVALRGKGLAAVDTQAQTYTWYAPDADTAPDTVLGLYEDPSGGIWIASSGAGLVHFDPKSQAFSAFTAAETGDSRNTLTSNYIYTLYPDPTDPMVLWLGTAKGGLVRFNAANNAFTSFRHDPAKPTSLSSDDVLAIYRDPSGSVWVGTSGGGLDHLDPLAGVAVHYTTASSSLPNDTIYSILPDDQGNLWMSTNGGGIVELDPKAKTFVAYDPADGAQNSEFTQGAAMRDKAGKLFFGGDQGFNMFLPKDIKRDAFAPPVVLTAFKLFNQEIQLDHPIWMQPKINIAYSDSFEIRFAAMAFAAPTKNRYAYQLEGFDDRFIETDRPYATYTKLAGGTYKLHVRSVNRHGVVNDTGVTLAISVRPPWWQTKWALAVYVLLGLLAAYALYRVQRARLERAQRDARLASVERDLELTGAVQTGFLPDHNELGRQHVNVFGFYRPAEASSGDWWWYDVLPGGRHIVLVGDVTGHGAGPAMVTAAVATAFRVMIEHGLDNVVDCMRMLHREVLRVGKGKYHMTMGALEVDDATGNWIFYSAGAPPLITLDDKGKHRPYYCPGTPLGTEDEFETGQANGTLRPMDRLFLFTDGIPEITLKNGNVLGVRRMGMHYEKTRAVPLAQAASMILQQADDVSAGQPQADDWTFAILEWNRAA